MVLLSLFDSGTSAFSLVRLVSGCRPERMHVSFRHHCSIIIVTYTLIKRGKSQMQEKQT